MDETLGGGEAMALIGVDLRRIGAPISSNLYGHFWEHFHRCIYGGIYDPGSPLASARGYREDVIRALRDIRAPLIRWPGGNFASSYHWEDGIGPREKRPVRFDPNWRVDESNTFGTDEFLQCCEEVGAEPCIVVNMGDGDVREAAAWVEYCNRSGESLWAARRRENGRTKPCKVRYWGLGNEVGYDHQVGAMLDVDDYIKAVGRYARSMKFVDPDIQLIASGLEIFHGNHGKRGADWYHRLVMEAGQWFDFVSVHNYFHGGFAGPRKSYEELVDHLNVIEAELKAVSGILETSRHVLKKRRPIGIVFDEWNQFGWADSGVFEGSTEPLEDNDRNSNYDMRDGLYSASLLAMFQRMSEYVAGATFSPTVNGRGLIYVDSRGIIKRPSYHVFSLYTQFTGTRSVDSFTLCGKLAGRPELEVSASIDDRGTLSLAVVNLNTETSVETEIEINGAKPQAVQAHVLAGAKGPDSYNDWGHETDVGVSHARLDVPALPFHHTFPACSVTVLQFPGQER